MIGFHRALPKFVHLDLKGAPPSLVYLRQLLPYLAQWGVTGLVIEYEDVFPYHGPLSLLRAVYAYSVEELRTFLFDCKALRMEIIPLVQTFGHMEFVLKHEPFAHLREHTSFSNSICPSNEESFARIAQMLDQIIDLHGDISSAIHIGCDEVHQLGVCAACVDKMRVRGWSRHRLFAEHAARVAQYCHTRMPTIRVLMWDDMLRGVDFRQNIQPTGLAALVEPVIWYYGAQAIPDVWLNLAPYKCLWAASAFKGASGASETTPDTGLHVANHKLWAAVIADRASTSSFAGFILTGWSRYDHFAVLCELLPTGIPSLCLNLHVMANGAFNEIAHRAASMALGYESELMPLVQRPRPQPIGEQWAFPGSAVYAASQQHANLVKETYDNLLNGDWMRAWFNEYYEVRSRVHVGMVQQLASRCDELLMEWRALRDFATTAMMPVYCRMVIEEWIGSHVDVHLRKLESTKSRLAKHC